MPQLAVKKKKKNWLTIVQVKDKISLHGEIKYTHVFRVSYLTLENNRASTGINFHRATKSHFD